MEDAYRGGGECECEGEGDAITCARCGGLVSDFEDELSGLVSAKCWNCGRDPRAMPTKAELVAAGVYATEKTKEGHHRRGVEYTPAHFYPPVRHARREHQNA